jgi:AbrB family transcriptional regulator (stage V sporulation protein T)
MTYHAKVIAGGKIVIPAELRREFGIKDGDSVAIERDGNTLVLKPFGVQVAEAQRAFRKLMGKDYSVGQFLAERKTGWTE